MTDEAFEQLVLLGIGALPEKFRKKLKNVAFIIEDEPSPTQRKEMALDPESTLLGLYEGIPQSERDSEYFAVLPDKITIFKKPILEMHSDPEAIKKEVADTVWHEVGHHFGLDEDEVEEREHERAKEGRVEKEAGDTEGKEK